MSIHILGSRTGSEKHNRPALGLCRPLNQCDPLMYKTAGMDIDLGFSYGALFI